MKLESFCLFTLDEGRGRKKKIKEPVEDIEILHCLTLMNAQTRQPEKRKHSIFGVKKINAKPSIIMEKVLSLHSMTHRP